MHELLVRLTSNKLGWQVPTGHKWDKKYQKRADISFDRQYGFGHEEWLLNSRYLINGYQYGYIRVLEKQKYTGECIEKLHLYTVEKLQQKNRTFYLGYVLNVEVLVKPQKDVVDVFRKYDYTNMNEVDIVQGDPGILGHQQLRPIIRFKLSDKYLFDQPQLVEAFPLSRYKRYNAIEMNSSLRRIIEGIEPKNDSRTKFISGKASQKEKYNRNSFHESLSITRNHSKIINELETFLYPEYSLKKKNLSIEKMCFAGNFADVVTLGMDKSIDIYEIKTTLNGRKNIRDAISQLLDYACHAAGYKVNRIVIVSPCRLNGLYSFFRDLKKNININLEYLYFEETAERKFTFLN